MHSTLCHMTSNRLEFNSVWNALIETKFSFRMLFFMESQLSSAQHCVTMHWVKLSHWIDVNVTWCHIEHLNDTRLNWVTLIDECKYEMKLNFLLPIQKIPIALISNTVTKMIISVWCHSRLRGMVINSFRFSIGKVLHHKAMIAANDVSFNNIKKTMKKMQTTFLLPHSKYISQFASIAPFHLMSQKKNLHVTSNAAGRQKN